MLLLHQTDEMESDSPPDMHSPGPYPVPNDGDFVGPARRAPLLHEMANQLIEDYESFEHLRSVTLAIYWKRKGGSSQGRKKYSGHGPAGWQLNTECGADFVIWLAADHCRLNALDKAAIMALLRHELCHIQPGPEDGQLIIAGHDFEGFYTELDGDLPVQPWLRKMVWGAQQLELILDPPDENPYPSPDTDQESE